MNEYNHITATYFLLAERKLRAQRVDLASRMTRSLGTSALLASKPSELTPQDHPMRAKVEEASSLAVSYPPNL